MERMDFADAGILVALADDQHGLRLVAHLRSDMSAHVVVPFVQMKHTVDVQVVSRRPFHHPVDDFHRFTGIIDVEHQVANAVDDDQSVAFLLAQRIVDDLDTHRRRIFTQAEKSRFSGSVVVGNPASRNIRSNTERQWKRLCSVSTYRIRCLPSGRCAR